MENQPTDDATVDAGQHLTYDDWADLLADFFFDPAHDGEEVLFTADDLALSEASGLDPEEAIASLGSAVASVIGFRWGVENIHKRVRAFRADRLHGPHPALPFLALTVLAATQMGADSDLAANDYYRPLRRLIDPEDTGKGAPGSFTQYIRLLWVDLAKWANDDLEGRRGRLRVRPPHHFTYIGYGLQHALIRSSDLRRLDEYFRRIGLEPGEGEDVSTGELRRGLELWVSRRHESWARRLHRVAADEDLAEYCEAVLERAARTWDGRPRDVRTGRPVGNLRIGTSSLRRLDLGIYAQRDERLPEALTIHVQSTELNLTPWHGWFEPLPLPVDPTTALNEGLELAAGNIRFTFNQTEAHALGYDDDLGQWVSVDRLVFGDRYALLIRSNETDAVMAFLRDASAVPPKTSLDPPGLPQGWDLIQNVQLNVQPTITPPDSIASIIPAGSGPRLRLLEGLSIGSERHVYLRGGEPALALSSLVEDDEFEIHNMATDEWKSYRVPEGSNREAPLWELQLEPGDYQVKHGDVSIRFTIVDGIAETAGPGVGSVTQHARDGVEVSGVSTTASGRPELPLTVKAPAQGTESYLIGPGPADVHSIELPIWIGDHLGFEPSWTQTDAWIEFSPAWQVMLEDDGGTAVPIDPVPPLDAAARPEWSDVIRDAELVEGQSEDVKALWESYVELASKGHQRG